MWLSIIGLYEYDNTVFDGLKLPEYTDDSGVVYTVDREALINNILLKCAELEVIYPRLETMKMAIAAWSVANQNIWKKLMLTEYVNYNPIWNVDADIKDIETITGGRTENRTIGTTGQDKRTADLTDQETVNLADTKSVKGFNSDSWAEAEKNTKSGTDTVKHTGTDTIDKKENVVDNVAGSDNSTREYTQRRTGNIGVTATQDLIEKERSVAEFSIINYITMSFKNEFCLLIY